MKEPRKYYTKPDEITAMLFTEDNGVEIVDWLGDCTTYKVQYGIRETEHGERTTRKTIEFSGFPEDDKDFTAYVGDYIMKDRCGVQKVSATNFEQNFTLNRYLQVAEDPLTADEVMDYIHRQAETLAARQDKTLGA